MKKTGFTMLELIVAVGVFSVVATLSVSSLLSLTGAQKKALAIQSVQDNLRFSLRTISQDLMTGNFFYCGADINDIPPKPPAGDPPITRDCSVTNMNGGAIITFFNKYNNVVTYRMSNTTPDTSCDPNSIGHHCIEKAVRATHDAPLIFTPVTSQDVEIKELAFFVAGSFLDDKTEPRITMLIKGVAGQGANTTEFNLQTTVSQRTTQRQ